jgi:hypothetical protein
MPAQSYSEILLEKKIRFNYTGTYVPVCLNQSANVCVPGTMFDQKSATTMMMPPDPATMMSTMVRAR